MPSSWMNEFYVCLFSSILDVGLIICLFDYFFYFASMDIMSLLYY